MVNMLPVEDVCKRLTFCEFDYFTIDSLFVTRCLRSPWILSADSTGDEMQLTAGQGRTLRLSRLGDTMYTVPTLPSLPFSRVDKQGNLSSSQHISLSDLKQIRCTASTKL
ncbi:hypothetical protein J6590_014674 [Homalodisca vitripennis]|nr:hypothetical protein J6590_014674 [Homalodisca vitripennis]